MWAKLKHIARRSGFLLFPGWPFIMIFFRVDRFTETRLIPKYSRRRRWLNPLSKKRKKKNLTNQAKLPFYVKSMFILRTFPDQNFPKVGRLLLPLFFKSASDASWRKEKTLLFLLFVLTWPSVTEPPQRNVTHKPNRRESGFEVETRDDQIL